MRAQSEGGFAQTLLLMGYLVAKPFYIFSSGNPQVADGLISLAFFAAFFSQYRVTSEIRGILQAIVLFCIYAFFVNGMWGILIIDVSMLKSPIFYAFNAAVVYVIMVFWGRGGDRAIRWLLIGIVVSLALQFLLAVALGKSTVISSGRNILFFNNPNQLGYWALLSASIFSVLTRARKVNVLIQFAVFAMAFYLVAISLSKAATAALALLVLIHFSRKWWHFFVAFLLGFIVLWAAQEHSFVANLIERMSSIGEQADDSLMGRGYAQIWHYPEYLLFGAAEGGLQRFPGVTHELHSTLGTVFFSYGVIGTFLFGMVLWRIYRRSGFANFLYLAPAFAYGLTHQGLRFSLLWVLFAALAITGRQRQVGSAASSGLSIEQEPGGNGADSDRLSFRSQSQPP